VRRDTKIENRIGGTTGIPYGGVDGTCYVKTLIKESSVQSYEGAQSNQPFYYTLLGRVLSRAYISNLLKMLNSQRGHLIGKDQLKSPSFLSVIVILTSVTCFHSFLFIAIPYHTRALLRFLGCDLGLKRTPHVTLLGHTR